MTTKATRAATRGQTDGPALLPTKPCPACEGTGAVPDGRGLRALRESMGLTRTEMALRLRVSSQYLYLVETGRSPISDRTYQKLVREMGRLHARAR